MRKKWWLWVKKRWLWVILGIGVLMLVGGGFLALMDRPTLSQDEVRAIVHNHFNKSNTPSIITSMPEYLGDGKWAGYTTYFLMDTLWNRSLRPSLFDKQVDWYFYEKTRTIEIRRK